MMSMSRQVEEREGARAAADDVEASRVAAGRTTRTAELAGEPLIVEPGSAAKPGQMDKRTFLGKLAGAAGKIVKDELGGLKGSIGASKVKGAINDLADRPASELEAKMHAFCPPTRGAATADAALALLLAELRKVVAEYKQTGEFPSRAKQLFASVDIGGEPTRLAAAPRDAMAAADEPVDALEA